MQDPSEVNSREEIRAGLKDGLTIAWAYLPFGLSYGMFAHSQGLPWWLSLITALVIYAGSMEFLAAGMLVAGAPLGYAASTALMVNSRHILYGLSVPLQRIRNPFARAYAIHALTDEMYAVCTSLPRDLLTAPRMLAIAVSGHFYWVFGTVLGAVVAMFLPFDLSFMSFAVVALFIVLGIDAARASGEWWMLLAGVAIASVAALVTPNLILVIGLVAYAILAGVVVAYRRSRGIEPPVVTDMIAIQRQDLRETDEEEARREAEERREENGGSDA